MKWQHFPESPGVTAQTRKLPAILSEKEGRRTPCQERGTARNWGGAGKSSH